MCRIDADILFFFKTQNVANSLRLLAKFVTQKKGKRASQKCIGYFVTMPKSGSNNPSKKLQTDNTQLDSSSFGIDAMDSDLHGLMQFNYFARVFDKSFGHLRQV